MTTFILLGIALAGIAVLGLAATRPNHFRVERGVFIAQRPEHIFPLIDDLRAMSTWNPFEKQDATLTREYGGQARGQGAWLRFSGRRAGTGRIAIDRSSAPTQVEMTLEMTTPFKCCNQIEFLLSPEGQGTRVVWTMQGPVGFPAKIMQIFMNMDRMVGTQFAKGLADLKELAERPSRE